MGKLRLLFDTHVLLWALLEPHKLPEGLRAQELPISSRGVRVRSG